MRGDETRCRREFVTGHVPATTLAVRPREPRVVVGNKNPNHPMRSLLNRIPSIALNARITSATGQRSPALYDAVLDQFEVETNPRYAPRHGKTYCNIFIWDVTRAMGAEVPFWTKDGEPASRVVGGSRMMNTNAMAHWLETKGLERGWRRTTESRAIAAARRGEPALAIRINPAGHGHVAMVRPSRALVLAQAGSRCFARGSKTDSFGAGRPSFWIHS